MKAIQLKNAILQLAVQGKLVEQNPSDEPASTLVASISRLTQNKKPLKPITDDEIPFEIPDSWVWVRLGDIGNFTRGNGIKRSDITPSGVPCIRYGEIYTRYHTLVKQVFSYVSEEYAIKLKPVEYCRGNPLRLPEHNARSSSVDIL